MCHWWREVLQSPNVISTYDGFEKGEIISNDKNVVFLVCLNISIWNEK
jgi:hypothetical protein